jgi:peptide/nickel transport system permease protein
MIGYALKRLAQGVIVVWIVATLTFGLFFLAPNNVARAMAGPDADPQTLAQIEMTLGLDRPVLEQYTRYLGNLLSGDFGTDYYHGVAVSQTLADAVPVTLSLVAGATVLWVLLGVGGGMLSAARPGSLLDRGLTLLALVFYSAPTFLLGVVLLFVFFFKLTMAGVAVFPAGGYAPLADDPMLWAQHLTLPWLTIALVLAATYVRLTRSAMLDVLDEDHIRTARAKGVSGRAVFFRHGLRSASTPIVTQIGVDVGQLVGGVVVAETVFSLPGLGKLAVDAITQQNLPVVLGVVIVASAAVVITNLVVDLLYVPLDPRVTLR